MQRRFFIRNIALLGFGLGAFPNKLFAEANQWTVLNLPTQLQVRHGLLNLIHNQAIGEEWWESLEKNIFYKNGYEASEEDLTLYSFGFQQKKYLITLKNKLITIGADENSHLFSTEGIGVLYQNEDKNLSISIIEGDILTNQEEEMILIPISKQTKINDYTLQNEEIVKINSTNQTISLNKKILIIKTKKLWTNQQLQEKPLSA